MAYLTIYVKDEQLLDALQTIAHQQRRSVSKVVCDVLFQYLESSLQPLQQQLSPLSSNPLPTPPDLPNPLDLPNSPAVQVEPIDITASERA